MPKSGLPYMPGLRWLVGLNVAVFAATLTASAFSRDLIGILGLHAACAGFWQPLSYMFTHGGLMHLLVNMLVLVAYATLGATLGLRRSTVPLYLGGGFAGAAAFLISAAEGALLVGASAAVLAGVTATTVWAPAMRVKIPWLGRTRLLFVSLLIITLSIAAPLASGLPGSAAAHTGGILFGMMVAVLFLRRGRAAVGRRLSEMRSSAASRCEALEKARTSGFSALSDVEKKAIT